jgi:hypothetical protein
MQCVTIRIIQLHSQSKIRLLKGNEISFLRNQDVDEISAFLGYYAASNCKSFTDVSGQRIGPIIKG